MVYAWILLSLFTFSVQAMEQPVVTIWAPHGVLLKPTLEELLKKVPKFLNPGTPKELEKGLIATTRGISYTNKEVQQHVNADLSPLFVAWLLDSESSEDVESIVCKHIGPSILHPIDHTVATTAFSPKKAASSLKLIAEIISLVQACQQQKHQTVLASNWNSESFAEIEKQHPKIVDLFEHRFTSGKPGKQGNSIKLTALTSEPIFFQKIKRNLGEDKVYYYIDSSDNTESLDAAKQAGMTPIIVPDSNDKEKAATIKSQLVKYGLLTE